MFVTFYVVTAWKATKQAFFRNYTFARDLWNFSYKTAFFNWLFADNLQIWRR